MSMPSPPDPYATAAAQGAENRSTAQFSSVLNNANENTPYGSVSYDQNHYKFTDAQGNPYTVDRPTRTVTLSEAEQGKLDLSNQLQTNILTTANNQLDTISKTLSKPIDTSSAPDRVDSVATPNFRGENFRGPNLITQGASTPRLLTEMNRDAKPDLYTKAGPMANLITDMAEGTKPNLTTSYTPQGGFSQDRMRVEEALMSRLAPQFERDRAALETQLVNQGFTRGSDAFNNAMDEARRAETDARFQATLAGGQEQSRLLGESRAAAEFGNQASQQGFANELARRDYINKARQQGYENQLGAREFANVAQQQGFQNELARRDYLNTVRQQDYGNQMGDRLFTNAARQQGFQNDATSLQMRNAAKQAQLQADLQAGGFQNDARANAIQEMYAERNQPLNEIAAAISGSQVNNPQFMSMFRQGVEPAPVADSVYRSAQMEQQNAANMWGGISSLFTAPFSMFGFSDERLKENIRPVGETKGGTPLYSWNYKGDPETRIGPMAQEVAETQPEAVGVHKSGFLGVDYSKLH